MILILIPLIILILVVQGVRVIRGHYPVSDPGRDEASVRRWEWARKRGFLAHSVRSTGPAVLGICLLGPFVRSSWETGYLVYPLHQVPLYCAVAVVGTLLGGFFEWKILGATAHEAQQRLQDAHANRGGKS